MTTPTAPVELTVITKTYDLILWSCNHTGKFPRNHRFVLGERIERNLYDLLVLSGYMSNKDNCLWLGPSIKTNHCLRGQPLTRSDPSDLDE